MTELKDPWLSGPVALKFTLLPMPSCSRDLLLSRPSEIFDVLAYMFYVLLSDEKHPIDGTNEG